MVLMTVTIDKDLFKKIDRLRGREKRSTSVEHSSISALNSRVDCRAGASFCTNNSPRKELKTASEKKTASILKAVLDIVK